MILFREKYVLGSVHLLDLHRVLFFELSLGGRREAKAERQKVSLEEDVKRQEARVRHANARCSRRAEVEW